MTHDGLYIPMLNHIHSLCMTGHFGQCRHYLQGCNAIKACTDQLGLASEASRRRYRRVDARIPMKIVEYGQDGRFPETLDNEAFAVDLSWGGIRLSTKVALPVRKTVTFVFGQDEEIPVMLDGQGEVRWSRKTQSGAFHSGLLVTDKKTFEALGQRMVAS
ncbi:MAG: PilZ domain-containing protein [Proteobacteria bacterium]|nr:PilZ domain-containing protein [Pseudomonadota bacterium]